MRIDKYICACTTFSRNDVKKLVKSGRITVDSETVKKADIHIDENAHVALDNETLVYREFVYIMLNKPKGFISAVFDKHYPVVTDLIGEEYAKRSLAPVGRLDLDTEGLLLLTDDGGFNHSMTTPKKNIYKRYFAVLDKPAEESDKDVFGSGMEFKDFTAKPARLEICENPNEVFIEIAEGKFHQVKRMCERTGKSVTYLKRTAIGPLMLDENLESGEYRELMPEELASLVNLF